MTTKRVIKHLPLLLAGLALGLGVFSYSKLNKQSEPQETQASASSYWDSWISNNSSTINNGGKAFVTALKSKITQAADGNANTVSYAKLWEVYKESDAVPGSESLSKPLIWDMYGGFAFTYGDQQAGSYHDEGDVYNREHSVPKSWFSEKTPAYSDLVHLVPTDGKVNGMRSNYTFGEVQSATYSYSFNARSYGGVQYQAAGVSKLGSPKTINGVSSGKSVVFEPDDQYKGDFARIYMYFAVRYGGGTCAATTGDGGAIFSSSFTDSNPYVTNYGLALLRKWHVQDRVSTKETNRNNYIEKYQGNRNPFVDHPEWADKIFGTEYGDPTPGVTISQSAATIGVGGHITLTASASDLSTITWSSSNSSVASVSNGAVTGVAVGTATITASATINSNAYTATCAVTVSNATPTLQSISIETAPTKTKYVVGDYFDPTGLVITRNYSNSTTSSYTYAGHTSKFTFNPSTSTELTTGDTHVTITYGGKSTSQSITVTSSGGSGNPVSGSQKIVSNTDSTYYETGCICPTGNTTLASASCDAFDVAWSKDSGTNNIVYTYAEMRVYGGHSFMVTPKSDYSITSIVITANSSSYASAVGGSATLNCTKAVSGSTVTLTPTDGTSSVGFSNSAQSRLNYVVVNYSFEGSGSIVEPTSISASVSKTYNVGDTISISDVVVKNDLDQTITNFDFEDDGYQFTYDDAQSGGALTEVLFDDAISSGSFRCSLTVNVQRKAYVSSAEVNLNILPSDLPTAYSTDTSERTAASGIKFITYNCANYNTNVQFKEKGGYLQTTSELNLKTVTLNNRASNAVTVYGSNTAGSFSTTITGNNDVYNLSGYKYFKLIKTGSGGANFSSVTITCGGETPQNVANYIMFEDTSNQCKSKLNTAVGYLSNLSSSQRSTFATSSDYVISTARTRLEAWATSQGKTINYINGTLSPVNTLVSFVNNENNNAIIMLAILSVAGISAIGACIYTNKKKSSN